MTTDDSLLLSHAIPDELRNAGRDDLADEAARLCERLEKAEAEIDHLQSLARRQGQAVTQYEREANRYRRQAEENRQPDYSRQCDIRGPWRHVHIDEAYRGNPRVQLTCDYCNREPLASFVMTSDPPSPIRPRRMSIVEMMTHRFSDGREVSPAIHVGRCEACGTWYMG